MRKHFSPALEADTFGFQVALEDEEQEVLLSEAVDLGAEVPRDLEEAAKVEDTSDVLEDLAVIADGIQEATPAELALIRSVADMAVAGTDVQSEEVISTEVVPLQVEVGTSSEGAVATEAFLGRRISTETIREVARNIWESIKKFLIEIWNKIEKFFYNIFSTIPMLRRKLAALKKRVDAASDEGLRPSGDKLKINVGVAALCVKNVPQKSGAELLSSLDTLASTAGWIYGTYVDALATKGEKIAGIIKEYSVEDTGKAVKAMATLMKDGICKPLGSKGAADRYPEHDVTISDDLIGNHLILTRVKKSNAANEFEGSGSLEALRNTHVQLASSFSTAKDAPKEFEMAPLAISDMEKIIAKSEKLLDTLEDFKRGPKFKKVLKAKDDIKSAGDAAEKALAKVGEGEAAAAAIPAYRGLVNFGKAYAGWASSPTMAYFTYSISEIKALSSVVARSLTAYKAA